MILSYQMRFLEIKIYHVLDLTFGGLSVTASQCFYTSPLKVKFIDILLFLFQNTNI